MKDIQLSTNMNEGGLILKSHGNHPYIPVCADEKVKQEANAEGAQSKGNGMMQRDRKKEEIINQQ